jgi:hypothetical protein
MVGYVEVEMAVWSSFLYLHTQGVCVYSKGQGFSTVLRLAAKLSNIQNAKGQERNVKTNYADIVMTCSCRSASEVREGQFNYLNGCEKDIVWLR